MREKAEMTPFKKQEAVCKSNIQEAERELGCPKGTPVYDSAYRTKVRPWKFTVTGGDHVPGDWLA